MRIKTITLTLSLVALGFSVLGQSENVPEQQLKLVEEPGISQMREKYVEQNKAQPQLDGYRVQIYNGSKQETLKARSRFLGVFPTVPVYTVYESPEYKVQTGDFRTRLEAEKFLKQVVNEFGSGFVVKTKIKFPVLVEKASSATDSTMAE